MQRRRYPIARIIAGALWAGVILFAAGHEYFVQKGCGELERAGAELDKLRLAFQSRRFERPIMADPPLPGNAASLYREVIEEYRVRRPVFEACSDFFRGEDPGDSLLVEELDRFASILEQLRTAVRRERCDWNLIPLTRRTCSLGGATIARVGFDYDAWTTGLFHLAPLFAGASRLAELRGDNREAAQLLLEGIQVQLDMAAGMTRFDLIVAAMQIERFGHCLVELLLRTRPDKETWDHVARSLVLLRSRGASFLEGWKGNLLLEMHLDVYLPTTPRILLLEEGETSGAWMRLEHGGSVFFSRHAASARGFRRNMDLWTILESREISFDPEGLSSARQVIDSRRSLDPFHREQAEDAWSAILAAFELESVLRMLDGAVRVGRFFVHEERWPGADEYSELAPDLLDPLTGGEYQYELRPVPLIIGAGGYARLHPHAFRTLLWSFRPRGE